MGQITREDLKIILKFGIHLARVDANFHLEEKKVLKRFSEAIHITDEEREELMADASLQHGLDELASDSAKELLLKTLCAVAYVDGKTTPEEVAFVEKVLGKFEGLSFLLPKEEWGAYEAEIFEIIEENI